MACGLTVAMSARSTARRLWLDWSARLSALTASLSRCVGAIALGALCLTGATAHAQGERVNAGAVTIVTDALEQPDGRATRLINDLARELTEVGAIRVLSIAGAGGQANVRDLLFLRGVDFAVVNSDVFEVLDRAGVYPNARSLVRSVTHLFDQRVFLLARKPISTVIGLDGSRVGFFGRTNTTGATAEVLFANLPIRVELVDVSGRVRSSVDADRSAAAAAADDAGRIDGLFVLQSELATLARAGFDLSAFQLVEIPRTGDLERIYDFVNVNAALIAPLNSTAAVTTIRVATVLATFNWRQPGTRRTGAINFINAFYEALPKLRRSVRADIWQQVDVFRTVRGIERYGEARPDRVLSAAEQLGLQAVRPSTFAPFPEPPEDPKAPQAAVAASSRVAAAVADGAQGSAADADADGEARSDAERADDPVARAENVFGRAGAVRAADLVPRLGPSAKATTKAITKATGRAPPATRGDRDATAAGADSDGVDAPQAGGVTVIARAPTGADDRAAVAPREDRRPPMINILAVNRPPFADPGQGLESLVLELVERALAAGSDSRFGPPRMRVVWAETDPVALQAQLESGRFDAVVPWEAIDCGSDGSLTAATAYLCDQAVFSKPLMSALIGLFVPIDRNIDPAKPETLARQKVCIGSERDVTWTHLTLGDWQRAHQVELERRRNTFECLVALQQGEVAALIANELEARHYIKLLGVERLFKMAGQPLATTGLSAAVFRDLPRTQSTIDAIARGIDKMKADDTYTAVLENRVLTLFARGDDAGESAGPASQDAGDDAGEDPRQASDQDAGQVPGQDAGAGSTDARTD